MQARQNVKLLTTTGYRYTTAQDHLHAQTCMLSVRQHNKLLIKQFLLTCHSTKYPVNGQTTCKSTPHSIRQDIKSYKNGIQPDIRYNWNSSTVHTALCSFHTSSILTANSSSGPNRAFDTHHFFIHMDERKFPRKKGPL